MLLLLLRWFLNALALLIVSQLVPGFVVTSFYSALVASLVLGLANATVRPILLLMTLPLSVLTLGVFTLVLNALIILLVATIVKNFEIQSFSAAFWGGIILWLISWLSSVMIKSVKQPTVRQHT